MKERPILFSSPMVRAILAGAKTQTRRVVKPLGAAAVVPLIGADDKPTGEFGWCPNVRVITDHIRCPYGRPSDRLWVREAFIHEPADYCWEASVSIPCRPASTTYRADVEGDSRGAGWKPSIHMPRSLSRITLEITDVRIERLQGISEADAIAEGVDQAQYLREDDDVMVAICADKLNVPFPVARYVLLWDSINGTPPNNWNSNPWVWAISFKRIAP